MTEPQPLLEYFGLRAHPFAPTADPSYFYATHAHKECLFRLWSSIDDRNGICVVLGNYGTGKTTLLRKLVTGMAANPQRYSGTVIASPIPSWTSFSLLEAIVLQFGLSPGRRSFAAYMDCLNQYLLDRRSQINTLIIDDAQNLNKRGQLELLRLVQNLETPQFKLLNLVLFAQLEWMQILRAAPNFEQRINMTYTLSPLSVNEVREFIEFRLKQAVIEPSRAPEFDDGSVQVIHAYSEGNPRTIVTLCRNAMLVAAQIGQRRIGHELVLHTIEKTTLPDAEKRTRVAMSVMNLINTGNTGTKSASPPPVVDDAQSRPNISKRAHPQEDRASWLLLRAARARQGQDGMGA